MLEITQTGIVGATHVCLSSIANGSQDRSSFHNSLRSIVGYMASGVDVPNVEVSFVDLSMAEQREQSDTLEESS